LEHSTQPLDVGCAVGVVVVDGVTLQLTCGVWNSQAFCGNTVHRAWRALS